MLLLLNPVSSQKNPRDVFVPLQREAQRLASF
jgi:hypothetical protein